MKKIFIFLMLLLLMATTLFAQTTYYVWRYREHATDCTSLTDGKARDICKDLDDGKLWVCNPTSGDCDTVGEWIAVDTDTDTDTQDLSLVGNTLSLVNGGSVDLSPYLDDTDTTLSEEQVEDYVGGMVTGNTETLVSASYQDDDGTIDFVVDSDLSKYNNTTSAFIKATDVPANETDSAHDTCAEISGCVVGAYSSLANLQSAVTNDFHNLGGTDANTTYTASGTLLNLSTTTFSLKEGTLTNGLGCKYVVGTGIVCDQAYLTVEVDGSTTNEIEVVDETYNATNFNGGTASAVSQDDFYDLMHTFDTDDDGLPNVIDTTTDGFVKTSNSNGTLTIDTSTYLTSVASDSDWTTHGSYPSACSAGQYVSALGDTLTCGTPTDTNTNAATICSGTTTYLDGEGNCDDISSVYESADTNIIKVGEIDTFSELDAIVADKALVNKADGAVWSGVHDFGGATSLEIPNDATPTVNAAGEIAVDTTDDQLLYYGGAERVLTYKQQKCFALESPTADDDDIPIFFPTDAITVTAMYCMVEGGTSAEITLSDGTNALDTMTCDGDGAADDGSIANSTFTASEEVQFDTGTVTGEVSWVTFCFTYTTTKE